MLNRCSNLKLQAMNSGSSNVTPKTIVRKSTPFQRKIDSLRKQLEKATWENEPNEDEIEEQRLENLYA